MYELAYELRQPLSAIFEMTIDEFTHWFTFLKIRHEKAKNGSRSKHSPGN